MASQATVLIVDDEVRGLESLARILEDDFDVRTVTDTGAAEKILADDWVQIILCDQRMPETTGVEFLKQVRDKWPEMIRMIISGYTDSEDIISAVNEAGVFQYITKPRHPDNLIPTLKNAARLFELQRENELLSVELKMAPQPLEQKVARGRETLRRQYRHDDGMVRSEHSVMNAVCDHLKRIAAYDISVLLHGESGTGKELAARSLHYNSPRWERPFVVENCGALPDELLESELFGYKRGAFTGAVEDRVGLFERANGGAVFLDEIGEVSSFFQVKLLRVLQEGEFRPLGSGQTRRVNVRVVAATNKDLEEEVRAGRFREDLYYRLASMTVILPPLRERAEDIPVLARALLDQAQAALGKQVKGFTDEALACLQEYHWPGNVRELRNEIQRMLVMGSDELLGAELLAGLEGSLKQRVESLEARILRETLIRNRWNKSRAAKELGLSRVGLRSKLDRYGLEQVESVTLPESGTVN